MNVVVFDTLLLAQKLEAAGFTMPQARGAAAALAETLGDHVASRRDVADGDARLDARLRETETVLRAEIKAVRTELGHEIQALRVELRSEIELVRTELGNEIQAVRTELRNEIQAVRTDLGHEIQTVRTELGNEIKAFRAEMRELDQRMTIRLGGMLAAAIVLVGAMVKLL